MKKFFLLLLISNFTAIAQITYQPGYFINNNGDKTQCLIRNIGWKNNPFEFSYKLNEEDEPKTKTTDLIREFSVDGYKFRKFEVDIDRSSNDVNLMSTSPKPEWTKETLLLKVLVEGQLTLYQFEDGNLIKYFISDNSHTSAEQLMYREYRVAGTIRETNNFRQQLYNYMKGELNEISRFENLKYNKDELVKLFVEYNGNNNNEVKNLAEKQNKGSIHLKITPGVNLTSFRVSNNLLSFDEYEFSNKAIFRIGAELEYVLPFNNNKWSLFIDPNYQYYRNDGNKAAWDWKVEYKYIQLPAGFRYYMFLNKESKLFLNAAYSLSFNLGDNYLQYNSVKLDIAKTSTFLIGAGYNYKKYSAEVRYTFTHSPLGNYGAWEANLSSVGIILGYRIF